mmetsp:Transcript_58935/g.175351  ORF Transcript_58935/g.175351 Transcript_58935/m.175351 type:complete len:233 (-) Transcript_58935:1341-2039(-)
MESKSKTEVGMSTAKAIDVRKTLTICRGMSQGGVTLSLSTGSATSCGLTPQVKMKNATTMGTRLSDSPPTKVNVRRAKAAQGSRESRTPRQGTAAKMAMPSVSKFPSGKAFNAAAKVAKEPATSASGAATNPLPSGGWMQKPWRDSAREWTSHFRMAGKRLGLTHAQLSGSGGRAKLPAIRAAEANRVAARAAAAMSKSAAAPGTTDRAREAAPKVPIAGEGKKKGGLRRTP